MGERMVADGLALKKLAIYEQSNHAGGVCTKRGYPFEVDCGGEVAHRAVDLVSRVNGDTLSAGFEIGGESRGIDNKQLAAIARKNRRLWLSLKRMGRKKHVPMNVGNRSMVGDLGSKFFYGSQEIDNSQLTAAARKNRRALLSQKRVKREKHVKRNVENGAVVGDTEFNLLTGHKSNKRRRATCANRERLRFVECHDSNRVDCLDFRGSNVAGNRRDDYQTWPSTIFGFPCVNGSDPEVNVRCIDDPSASSTNVVSDILLKEHGIQFGNAADGSDGFVPDVDFRPGGVAPQPNSSLSLTQKKKKTLLKSQRKRGRKKIIDLERVLTEPHSLRPPILCELCGARKFEYESKGFCCSNGEVVLKLNDTPSGLYELFTSLSDEAKEFKTCVRVYNSNFAFASLGVKCDEDLCKMNKGVYTFRVQGQIHHIIKQLIPVDRPPAFLQLYFYDTDHELQHRLNFSDQVTPSMISRINDILKANPYCQFFRRLGDLSNLESRKIRIKCDAGLDQRVYNAPSASQIAAIWVGGDSSSGVTIRDIVVSAHGGDAHRIHYYFGCYDPLQYPLLFPYGETGWHRGIKKFGNQELQDASVRGEPMDIQQIDSVLGLLARETAVLEEKKTMSYVSCRQYYSYKLQIRPSHKSSLLHSGRLLQQYVVDMYVKVESSRLDYFRGKQAEIRADLYQGIVDAVGLGETRGHQMGHKIILPATFIGGPRDMRRRYMDAMALVQRFGKPDVFLTITCNPNWAEIKAELGPNDMAQDRPDLVSRVFKAKLEELKNDLLKRQILGPVAAYVYVIEFQKRGLPHAHFLLVFKSVAKLVSPDKFDKIVSAELPDANDQPYLHSLVVKHMMHGPCGDLNPKNVCMKKNGKCRSHYPKPFCLETQSGDDSFPQYRRRNDQRKVKVRRQYLDNRWVVPYNPYLLAKFDCHINVEICSSIKAVKYLYKYIYKGHDRVCFSVDSNNSSSNVNEIDLFQSARWVSPPEATWRIFGFTLSEIHPHVISLQLHLQDNQLVTFHAADDLSNVIHDDLVARSMLTEYFRMNSINSKAKSLLYRQFPEHFVWDRRRKNWSHRKKCSVIGRVITAHPGEGERYYLRLLLNHIRGATSFDDLKTVNGLIVPTFREAALLHGLLEGDHNYDLCIEEAVSYRMPFELRRLFATLLVFCDVQDPKSLWEKYKGPMCDDYVHKKIPIIDAEITVLQDINFILESMGKNVNDYNLVAFHVDLELCEKTTKVIDEELQIGASRDDLQAAGNLNPQQKFAFDLIMSSVVDNQGGLFFIDGPGGTGKTYLYRALLAATRSKSLIALATASSGVAAGILPGGRTAHTRFRIPLQLDENSVCSVSKQSALSKLLQMTKLIIWDEAPMVHRYAIEAVDKMLQDINDSQEPFGGKIVVFGGDFRQVLPVVPGATKEDVIKASLVNSYLWKSFSKIELVENMRARFDQSFCNYLLKIGNGNEECDSDGRIQLPSTMVLPYIDEASSLQQLIDVVFPSIDEYPKKLTSMINRVILTPKNDNVDQINSILMEQFPGDVIRYYSFDECIDKTEKSLQQEFLNILAPNGMPPHELILKKNCPIILLRNINAAEGLCNGTRLICRHFERNVIDAEIAVGENSGKRVFLPRIPFVPIEGEKNPFPFRRTQFPIRPCFAMTINKAQGQTLEFVGLYLPEPVFSHGQLYVALSRAKKAECIKVLIKTDVDDPITRSTKNVVYHKILQLAKTGMMITQKD